MEAGNNDQNQNVINEISKNDKRSKRNSRRRERYHGVYNLSRWHAARLRILQDKDDFASFIQFIKWKGGNPPNERDVNEIEYLDDLTAEFYRLGGYEFFKEHHLDLPPIGIGGYEETY